MQGGVDGQSPIPLCHPERWRKPTRRTLRRPALKMQWTGSAAQRAGKEIPLPAAGPSIAAACVSRREVPHRRFRRGSG